MLGEEELRHKIPNKNNLLCVLRGAQTAKIYLKGKDVCVSVFPSVKAARNTGQQRNHIQERKNKKMSVKRGDIYYADLSPVVGSEQGGLRPVLIIQNDVGNRYSPTVIAAAITSRMGKTRLPTHIDIYADKVGLSKDSVILLEQIRTLDKQRLKEKMGHLDDGLMNEVNNAIAVSFGLGEQGAAQADGTATVPTGSVIA
jgi:mRNA interferase MazF